MKKIPKYAEIKHNIINQIHTGILHKNTLLPSEKELMEQYKVSRITIRRAIEELQRDGYVEKRQGRRCYIKSHSKVQELTTISSYTEEIIRQGMTPSRKTLSSTLRLCTEDEQLKLELDKADPVYALERIIYADERPLCYTTTVLPYHYFRDIEQYDFEKQSLYDVIENVYHIPIESSALHLKAISAPTHIAEALKVSQGFPLLFSNAITYGTYEHQLRPIEYFQTYYLTEHFEYSLIQKRSI